MYIRLTADGAGVPGLYGDEPLALSALLEGERVLVVVLRHRAGDDQAVVADLAGKQKEIVTRRRSSLN